MPGSHTIVYGVDSRDFAAQSLHAERSHCISDIAATSLASVHFFFHVETYPEVTFCFNQPMHARLWSRWNAHMAGDGQNVSFRHLVLGLCHCAENLRKYSDYASREVKVICCLGCSDEERAEKYGVTDTVQYSNS